MYKGRLELAYKSDGFEPNKILSQLKYVFHRGTSLQVWKQHVETSSILNPKEKTKEPSVDKNVYPTTVKTIGIQRLFQRSNEPATPTDISGNAYIQRVFWNKVILVNVSVLERRLCRKTLY